MGLRRSEEGLPPCSRVANSSPATGRGASGAGAPRMSRFARGICAASRGISATITDAAVPDSRGRVRAPFAGSRRPERCSSHRNLRGREFAFPSGWKILHAVGAPLPRGRSPAPCRVHPILLHRRRSPCPAIPRRIPPKPRRLPTSWPRSIVHARPSQSSVRRTAALRRGCRLLPTTRMSETSASARLVDSRPARSPLHRPNRLACHDG